MNEQSRLAVGYIYVSHNEESLLARYWQLIIREAKLRKLVLATIFVDFQGISCTGGRLGRDRLRRTIVAQHIRFVIVPSLVHLLDAKDTLEALMAGSNVEAIAVIEVGYH